MLRILFISILLTQSLSAQFTDRYWAFGDSAGIDFKNLANPQPANSILRVRGACASICDSAGDLLFYSGSPNWQRLFAAGINNLGYVINKDHEIMFKGDSLIGGWWYQSMVIVPMPNNDSLFYVFTGGSTTISLGFAYSIVDVKYNNGQGKIIQKNVMLVNDSTCDGITAVRHGNGRDWWVLKRSWKAFPVNEISVYLVSPLGVTALPTQYIGSLTAFDGSYRMKFNSAGNHLYGVASSGLMERLDFDRCTGILSNKLTYSLPGGANMYIWGFEVSPDESKLYVSNIYQTANQDTGHVIQFNLLASNFLSSADTLGTYSWPDVPGLLEIGPNGKIYLSTTWTGPDTCYDYLYCYGTMNTTNSNLSVINYPDSLSIACDFQPFSFYLGGHKAYVGLPNNHNYELDTLHGSPCDTLTSVGLNGLFPKNKVLKLYYNNVWQTVFVNAEELKGRKATLEFYNINGQLMERISSETDGSYFSKSSYFSSQADGIYIVRLSTEKEVLVGRFVKF
jgi:hypothetical protein